MLDNIEYVLRKYDHESNYKKYEGNTNNHWMVYMNIYPMPYISLIPSKSQPLCVEANGHFLFVRVYWEEM